MALYTHTLLEKFPQIRQNAPLAPFTTLKIGGPADLYYQLTDITEAQELFKTAKELDVPVFVLGGGSNTLFHDAGFRGLVIHIKAKNIEVHIPPNPDEPATIVADAGALLSQVLAAAAKNHLTGMENLTGLPGTVGGAVRGNAGAFGTETKDVLQKVLLYDQENGAHEVPADQLGLSYRSSAVKKAKGAQTVLRAWFQLKQAPPNPTQPHPTNQTAPAPQTNIAALAQRLKSQPRGMTSGSFFKNPAPDHTAGYLLDQAGCKGLTHGGAQISSQHANWIVNTGSATQKNIQELIKMAQEKVKEKFNITLEPEVQLVDEYGML